MPRRTSEKHFLYIVSPDYLVSQLFHSAFDFAFSVAKVALKSKLSEIHLKYALYLEDEVSSGVSFALHNYTEAF